MGPKRNQVSAFPCPGSVTKDLTSGDEEVRWAQPGMSLRDWFAGQALMGFAAEYDVDDPWEPRAIAADAFQIADAMLAEREGVE